MILLAMLLQLFGVAYLIGVGVFIGHHRKSWLWDSLREDIGATKAWPALVGFALVWPAVLMWERERPRG